MRIGANVACKTADFAAGRNAAVVIALLKKNACIFYILRSYPIGHCTDKTAGRHFIIPGAADFSFVFTSAECKITHDTITGG